MDLSFLIDLNNLTYSIKNGGPIILVDDDAEQHVLMKRCYELSNRSNELIFLSSAEACLQYLAKVSKKELPMPELILLDINMPGVDGFQTLKEIRKQEAFHELPVIMLTASSSLQDKRKALELGANGYWSKPSHIADYIKFFTNI